MKFSQKIQERLDCLKELSISKSDVPVSFSDWQQESPMIIRIKNTSDEIAENVVLFDSYNALRNGHQWVEDCLYHNCIEIKGEIPNVTYREILQQIACKGFDFEIVRVSYLVGRVDKKSILGNVFLCSKDLFGTEYKSAVYVTIDPYQFQNDVAFIRLSKNKYNLNGFTKIIIEKLSPNAELVLSFYPEKKKPVAKERKLPSAFFVGISVVWLILQESVASLFRNKNKMER